MIAVGAMLGWAFLGQSQARFTVGWANDRLTVHATDASLPDVVAEVARLTGLKVVGSDKLQGTITADFTDLLIVDALKKLLTDVNYFVQQDPAADNARIGLVLRVHSMARVNTGPVSADTVLRVPALDLIIEAEEEELEEERQEAEDDPDVAQEKKQYLDTARQLVENGAFGSAATVMQLQHYVESDNPELRVEAVRALSQRPITVSLPFLLETLSDDSIEVRRAAIDALGHATDPESLRRVGLLLEKDPDISLRYSALRVLALRTDLAAATVLLQKVADDTDVTVRDVARQMLAELQRLGGAKRPPFR